MSPYLVTAVVAGYFILLVSISWLTAGKGDSKAFFTGNKQSPWYLVAFGMIGASLSGVTFVSVPGVVAANQFTYMQMVLGFLVGYSVIALVLLPLYYKPNLVSIYGYLNTRFGLFSYKTGAFFFLLSRVIGSSFRLFLVAGVLQLVLFDGLGIPFWVTVAVAIILIWVYTFRGGIKTIVWTDTLQTAFMLIAVVVCVYIISKDMGLGFGEMIATVKESKYSTIFVWDSFSANNFFKQLFSGAFIAIVMTGLDQDMMQKNLTCKSLGESQKNMFWFSGSLVLVNLLFLSLGALLYLYASQNGISIPERADDLFPMLATGKLGTVAGIVFLLGIVAAAYSSADSALTSLTTSFCVDFLGMDVEGDNHDRATRTKVHIGFSLVLFAVILIFRAINDDSAISQVYTFAGFTYGPLLGLFTFGIFTKLDLKDKWVPLVCVVAPIVSYIIKDNAIDWFGMAIGFEILIINGALTFIGLLILAKKGDKKL